MIQVEGGNLGVLCRRASDEQHKGSRAPRCSSPEHFCCRFSSARGIFLRKQVQSMARWRAKRPASLQAHAALGKLGVAEVDDYPIFARHKHAPRCASIPPKTLDCKSKFDVSGVVETDSGDFYAHNVSAPRFC